MVDVKLCCLCKLSAKWAIQPARQFEPVCQLHLHWALQNYKRPFHFIDLAGYGLMVGKKRYYYSQLARRVERFKLVGRYGISEGELAKAAMKLYKNRHGKKLKLIKRLDLSPPCLELRVP